MEVRLTWTIKEYSVITKNSTSKIKTFLKSPAFSFSPNKIPHIWEVHLRPENNDQSYGIYLSLADAPVMKAITVQKCSIQFVDSNNSIFFRNRSLAAQDFNAKAIRWGWNSALTHGTLKKHSQNFTQAIKCLCFVEFAKRDTEPDLFQQYISPKFAANLHQQYLNGNHTDLTITCGSKKFRVHKVVLGAVSPVFDGMIKDNSEFEVDSEISPEGFEVFLNFLYTGQASVK